MPFPFRLLVLVPLLAACGTPQQRCINSAAAPLRPVDRLIAETEGNISRGYGLQATTIYRDVWVPCGGVYGPYGYRPAGGMCIDEQAQIIERPVAIDIDAERKKLAQLTAKRKELASAASTGIAQCKAEFPE